MASPYNLRSKKNTSGNANDDWNHKNYKPGQPKQLPPSTDSDSDDWNHKNYKPGQPRQPPPSTDSDSDDSTDNHPVSPQLKHSPLFKFETDLDTSSSLYDSKYSSPPSTTGSPSAITPSPIAHRRNKSTIDERQRSPKTLTTTQSTNDIPKNLSAVDQIKKMLNYSLVVYIIVGLLVIILVLLLAVVLYSLLFPSVNKPTIPVTEFKEFVSRINNLKNMFPSQDERMWQTLKSSTKHVLDRKNPDYPAVILFAVPLQMSKLGTCLAKQTAQRFTNTSQLKAYIDCRLGSHLDPGKQKLELDKQIHAHFKTGNAVVIDHVETLSPTAALLFHGTCDNDNAPFKDVLIALVFHLDIALDIKPKNVEVKIREYLDHELDVDKVGAMLTRIANNIVVVRQERNDMIDDVCL